MINLLLAAALSVGATTVVDSTVYPVYNHDRLAGSMIVVRSGDSVRVRYVYTDRNRGTRIEGRYAMRGDSAWFTEYRTVLADGRLGEPTNRLEIFGDSVRRWTPTNTFTQKIQPGAYYALSSTPFDAVRYAKYLLRQPNRTVILPGAVTVRLTVAKELTVPTANGRERVRLVTIKRGASNPQIIWLDSRNELFATEVAWFMTVRPGAEPALPTLRKAEAEFRNAFADSLSKAVLKPTNSTLVIKNGNLFDSESGVMRPSRTIVIRGDRIVSVTSTDSAAIPAGATVIDATGKTIMPGMWEMHGHLQTTSQSSGSMLTLSAGITTVRDLGGDPDVAVSQRDRAASGALANPRSILSGFIDGPGAWAGPTPNLVRTESEARRWVAHFDSLGYKQIKLYNLVHPDLIPAFADEAHKRGLRLSGHIPRGLSVPAAIKLGFDEINHAAFLFSTFYQDSLYVPTMRAYSLVATTVAPNIDVDGPAMTGLIDVLKQNRTVVDGTFSVWIVGAATGIAQAVGAGVSTDAARADANYLRLLKRLYDAGVTLVPGTDNFGSATFGNELELYEKAGIPAAAVLQIATIVSARVMKDDKDYGSVAPGKIADLFIVNGNPIERVSDVRKVEQVVRAGRLYDSAALRAAAGFGPQQ